MRFLERRRILREARLQDEQLVSAVAGLEASDGSRFEGDLAAVRDMWRAHERSREEALYEPAVRLLSNGPDVTVALASEHRSFRTVLDNMDVGIHDLNVAGRQQLSALSREIAAHAGHEERRVLRPLLRRLSNRDGKRLVESLASRGSSE